MQTALYPNLKVYILLLTLLFIFLQVILYYSFVIKLSLRENYKNFSTISSKEIPNYNFEPLVYNEDIFGPLTNDDFVVVIQVHNRLEYLQYVVNSHSKTKGIEKVLLVFSHDFYDKNINEFIQSIKFCKVIQIFFKHSIQLHSNRFPGTDPNDCPSRIGQVTAIKLNCTNALNPDTYGNYREATITQTKHHWWWKVNTIFSNLTITKQFEGLVVLFEEDHYVSEDYLYVLKKMNEICKDNHCNAMGLGNIERPLSYQIEEDVHITGLIPNMGLVLNRTTWQHIKICAKEFCKYDDYNWDWSLTYISNKCLKTPISALVLKNSRVYHIGNCGLHHKGTCSSKSTVEEIDKDLSTFSLYPKSVKLRSISHTRKTNFKPNGGWADIRDQNLCLNMTL